MNEKSLEVLRQYDIQVRHVCRGRGGMILNTNAGTLLFLECNHPDKYYERENVLTAAIVECGFENVDTYITNKNGGIITEDDDGRRYILKNWFDARECNVKDLGDLCEAVSTLAHLHKALKRVSEKFVKESEQQKSCDGEADNGSKADDKCYKEMQLIDTYTRHVKELKMASNYLKNKKKRSEFEQLAYKNIGAFYEEAVNAAATFNCDIIKKRLELAVEECELMFLFLSLQA